MAEEHICQHEKEIAKISKIDEMLAIMISIDKSLRGNGKPGLFTEFAVWKNTVAGLIALDVIIVGGLIALWIKG